MKTSNYLTREEVKEAIEELERECKWKQEALSEKFRQTYEKLKPANLIKETISDIAHSPGLGKNIVRTTFGLGLGFITNKLLNKNSTNVARKIAGTAIQLGISGLFAKRMPRLKSALKNIFSKRKSDSAEAA
ncbi:MAG: hypothetical protein C5B52_12680 [Bacteroidetes bacterium]|nr:MAG: hypothetical protein C5B52_12680 [Bacteroidota bacterium]